jgi:pimeloyl-ACP methyl ester carboxylesterase
MPDLVGAVTDAAVYAGPIPSAEAWFAGGERIGYDPRARAIVASQDAPLKVFLRGEGDLAHAISFLPGFPDGSFGWAKVLPHLPNAAAMPKLLIEYVGMGDSDKPKDYAYSTAERTDLVERIWRDLPCSPQRWMQSVTTRRIAFRSGIHGVQGVASSNLVAPTNYLRSGNRCNPPGGRSL